MALAIARHKPAKLILASRTKSKIEQVVSIIRESGSGIPVNTVVVDLSSQASIRRAAQDVKALTPKLDIVINNAGVNVQDYQLNKEGIEMHFGTNHIGLFLLTNLVMENIKKAAEESGVGGSTRIINLTSAGHRLSPIRFSDYNFKLTAEELPAGERPPSGLSDSITNPEVPYSPFIAYGQSKTANILFSLYLTEHLKERGIVSYSVHPGCM
jgi:NAD(P)-dependent dehydrogenase (short-subunit alcohol dehydrogenase family)